MPETSVAARAKQLIAEQTQMVEKTALQIAEAEANAAKVEADQQALRLQREQERDAAFTVKIEADRKLMALIESAVALLDERQAVVLTAQRADKRAVASGLESNYPRFSPPKHIGSAKSGGIAANAVELIWWRESYTAPQPEPAPSSTVVMRPGIVATTAHAGRGLMSVIKEAGEKE